MSCTNCKIVKPVPVGSQTLAIGTIDITNTPVYVIITDIITRRRYSTNVTSNGSGSVSFSLSTFGDFISTNYIYEIQVVQGLGNVPKTLTIGITEADCWQVEFEKYLDATDGETEAPTTYTLIPED